MVVGWLVVADAIVAVDVDVLVGVAQWVERRTRDPMTPRFEPRQVHKKHV